MDLVVLPPIPAITPQVPMARRGLGTKGNKVPILTNHFNVDVGKVDGHLFHYSVALFSDDGRAVDAKGVGRKVLDQIRASELASKQFAVAYDGEKSCLFTVGEWDKLQFTIVLDSVTSSRNTGSPISNGIKPSIHNSKTFKVEISLAAKIPMQDIANALRGHESSHEALQALDIARLSSFPKSFADVGGGLLSCHRGFHSSFRTTQSGLSLNIDVSLIVRPGPVVDFLLATQNVKYPLSLDWAKAERTLKNLRVKASPRNKELRQVTGLTDKTCKDQTFTLRNKDEKGGGGIQITVYDYFVNHRKIHLEYSADLPCINVGKPKRPTYFPIELCSFVSLQPYTKALSTLVKRPPQKPRKRMNVLSNALKNNNYDARSMLCLCGVSIDNNFTQVEGRVLPTPKLKDGNGEDFLVRNGRWNFINKRLADARNIDTWAVVNFSTSCDVHKLVDELIAVGRMKGVVVEPPLNVFEETPELRRARPIDRVEKMSEILRSKHPRLALKFLLCFLPDRKNCDIYGPWKRKCLSEFGVVTQCLSPKSRDIYGSWKRKSVSEFRRLNDHYLTNLLLKINVKLGGLNSLLAARELSPSLPMISKLPTLIMGMGVSPGQKSSDIPSIASVVSSRHWPSIYRYRACVRTQSQKLQMIDSLYKPVSETEDQGIMRELLDDFCISSGERKPDQIIIFRGGVSESQFNQVLNIELTQIIKACKHLDQKWCPKFTVIVAQKNHHTKFFHPNSPDNVGPGTIIDNKVCHPKNNDFYLCAHAAGKTGITRPTHYHVLLDQVGFSPDDLQELVHALSYVYQRSTRSISVVAPICYARLAARQLQWMKFEERTLKENIRDSMFFC